jgi:hypothetical protein
MRGAGRVHPIRSAAQALRPEGYPDSPTIANRGAHVTRSLRQFGTKVTNAFTAKRRELQIEVLL